MEYRYVTQNVSAQSTSTKTINYSPILDVSFPGVSKEMSEGKYLRTEQNWDRMSDKHYDVVVKTLLIFISLFHLTYDEPRLIFENIKFFVTCF